MHIKSVPIIRKSYQKEFFCRVFFPGSAIVLKKRPAMRSFGGHSLATGLALGIFIDCTINLADGNQLTFRVVISKTDRV